MSHGQAVHHDPNFQFCYSAAAAAASAFRGTLSTALPAALLLYLLRTLLPCLLPCLLIYLLTCFLPCYLVCCLNCYLTCCINCCHTCYLTCCFTCYHTCSIAVLPGALSATSPVVLFDPDSLKPALPAALPATVGAASPGGSLFVCVAFSHSQPNARLATVAPCSRSVIKNIHTYLVMVFRKIWNMQVGIVCLYEWTRVYGFSEGALRSDLSYLEWLH